MFSTHIIPAASLGLSARRSFHLAGQVPKSPRLAVVGSRAAHRRFVRACRPIAEAAHELGWSLISGGALGIDAAAHRAAIDVGLPQVAVLPCGSDQCYPPGNRRLMTEILEQPHSGVLFAHPPGTKTVRAMFASRNAVVVGLADAVVVVEAAMRSGSILTGRLARRSKTRLAAIVGSDGCGELIRLGATALPAVPIEPAKMSEAVRGWLRGEPCTAAPLVWPVHLQSLRASFGEQLELDIEQLDDPLAPLGDLLEAELLGLVSEVGPGRYIRLDSDSQ